MVLSAHTNIRVRGCELKSCGKQTSHALVRVFASLCGVLRRTTLLSENWHSCLIEPSSENEESRCPQADEDTESLGVGGIGGFVEEPDSDRRENGHEACNETDCAEQLCCGW